MITLQPICPENALVFKAVRLRALEESPTAFGSTYAREIQFPDEEWEKRAARWTNPGSMGFLAFAGGLRCGLVAGYAEQENPGRGQVISMWVDPAYRRAGVGKALIQELRAWARSCGLRELKLMVTSVNTGAIRFYEHLGFRMTGVTEPYPNDPTLIEYEMILPLRN